MLVCQSIELRKCKSTTNELTQLGVHLSLVQARDQTVQNEISSWAAVVAQLVERSLPTTEMCSFNPNIIKKNYAKLNFNRKNLNDPLYLKCVSQDKAALE